MLYKEGIDERNWFQSIRIWGRSVIASQRNTKYAKKPYLQVDDKKPYATAVFSNFGTVSKLTTALRGLGNEQEQTVPGQEKNSNPNLYCVEFAVKSIQVLTGLFQSTFNALDRRAQQLTLAACLASK